MNNDLAPIIIFAFNRLNALKHTVQSLLLNEEAKKSDVYIFVDGPRFNKKGEKEKVLAVQEYIKSIQGFKSIKYFFSETNKGLGTSIIEGVSQIISKYEKVIVLEDDLTFSTNFLAFMNQGLEKYANENKVFSICGYSNRIKKDKSYIADSYFCTRSSSWGWATWKDRWDSIDWELKEWESISKKAKQFNKWGGSDCFKMLKDWHNGKNQSWAIRFCFNQFLQQKVSLFPITSKVSNNGFDGEGTNCKKWSRFKSILDSTNNKNFTYPENTIINETLYKSAMSYHTIILRLWSKIMYLLTN